MNYLDFVSSLQTGNGPTTERLMIAIDVSPSMADSDWPPSRLKAATEAAAALIRRKREIAPSDEVGIVAYAGSANTVCKPMPVEGDAKLLKALRWLRTGSGTSISAALVAAQKHLPTTSGASWWDRLVKIDSESRPERVQRIILLTDGHHNSGKDPEPIARTLKSVGVCIDCIGIGGSPSAVDEALLKRIASQHRDGRTPRYVFIGDKGSLIQKFEELAGRITR